MINPKNQIQEVVTFYLRPTTVHLVLEALEAKREEVAGLYDPLHPVMVEYQTLINEMVSRLQHVTAGMPDKLRIKR